MKNKRLFFSSIPYLGVLEKAFLGQRVSEPQKPSVFILGLPRSGTTLVYQYIVHRLNVAYFTNQGGHYYLSPCLATYFQRNALGDYDSDFQSDYGKVRGACAPREAGSFWGRFFGFDDYVDFQDIPAADVQTLRTTISCIQHIFGDLPFINKNVKHMLRIDALSKIFPAAYFLIVERDLSQVALSVRHARYSTMEDPKEWWSVKPPNYSEINHLSIPEQIAHQLLSLQEQMNCDLSKLPQERVMRVSYESFCKNPEATIANLVERLGPIGFRNEGKDHFDVSTRVAENSEELELANLIYSFKRN